MRQTPDAAETGADYCTLRLTVEARAELRGVAARFGGAASRRVSMSEALLVALEVAEKHPSEVRRTLDARG